MYGFWQGDRVIILFGEFLQCYVYGNGSFQGYIGGDDFFVGYGVGNYDEVVIWMLVFQDVFWLDVESFYDLEY